jgi:hypothetical protein
LRQKLAQLPIREKIRNAEIFLMVFVSFLSFFITYAGLTIVQNESVFDCNDRQLNQKLRTISEYVKENYQTRDVLEHVDKIENTLNACKIDPASYGWGRGVFGFWRKTSFEETLKIRTKGIYEAARFRNVDKEYKDLVEYIQKNNIIEQYDLSELQEAARRGRSHASRCSKPVKVDVTSLGATRDQDSVGWCYAFTAADLISHKTGKRISAADIATVYNEGILNNLNKRFFANSYDSDFSGGRVGEYVEKIIDRGACLEESFRSDDNGVGAIDKYLDGIQKHVYKGDSLHEECKRAAQLTFGSLKMSELTQILETSAKHDVITNLANKSCQPRIDISNLKVTDKRVKYLQDIYDMFDDIDQQLESGNIIGITYFGSILRKKNNVDLNTAHASSIVDRRFNASTGQCEYLVRNSHGRSCGGYDPSYDCTSNGNVWLPQEQLIKSLRGVTYVE